MTDISVKRFEEAAISDDGQSVTLRGVSYEGASVLLEMPVDSIGQLSEILQQTLSNAADIASMSLSRSPDEAIVVSGFAVGSTVDNSNVILSLHSVDSMLYHFALPGALASPDDEFELCDIVDALSESAGLRRTH